MSKIVIDAREYSTSTGRYVSKLIYYLEKTDKENTYIVLLKAKDIELCKLTNPNFTKAISPYKEFSFGEQIGFAWQLYKLKADLVHFCMTQQPLLYFKKSVTTVHDLTTARYKNPDKNPYIFFIKQQIYKLVIWYASYKSKQIITPSNYVKKDLMNYTKIKSNKITVTYEAADKIQETAKPIKDLVGKQFLMYIGRPNPHKNLWKLIEAFDALKGMYPNLYLVLAGKIDKNYSDMRRRAASNNIVGIYITDYIEESEVRWLYENCQAYVFPSLSEGFGLPGVEAMAHGAPVVSSNATCLPEIYGKAAEYFDPKDKESLIGALSKVLADDKLKKRLIAKGYEQNKQYSWFNTAAETLLIYRQALAKK
jgi:glycosyltransferase involved in cell wall biosynthesis